MAQIITIFCEGPHDVAFIYRMLKSISYKSYDACKIGDLPIPFNQLIIREIEKSDVEKLNLIDCLLYTSPSPRDATLSRMPSSA